MNQEPGPASRSMGNEEKSGDGLAGLMGADTFVECTPVIPTCFFMWKSLWPPAEVSKTPAASLKQFNALDLDARAPN
jgi:hypothetical protein